MKIIINQNTDNKISDKLRNFGFEIIYAAENNYLPEPVNTHPDIQICIFDGKAVCDKEFFGFYENIFKYSKTSLICGKKKCNGNYPDDVAYNVKVVGDNAFHNYKHTDEILRESLSNKKLINVSQGYTGCNICKVNENAIITSDRLIHGKALENGIKSLLISQGDICLHPYEYGFIGGASFYFDSKVFFFGDISYHRDYKTIKSFCASMGSEIVCLSDDRLFDYGSAFVFE